MDIKLIFKEGQIKTRNKLWQDSLYANGHLWAKNERGGREYNAEILKEHEKTWTFIFSKNPYKTLHNTLIFLGGLAYLIERIYNHLYYLNKNYLYLKWNKPHRKQK